MTEGLSMALVMRGLLYSARILRTSGQGDPRRTIGKTPEHGLCVSVYASKHPLAETAVRFTGRIGHPLCGAAYREVQSDSAYWRQSDGCESSIKRKRRHENGNNRCRDTGAYWRVRGGKRGPIRRLQSGAS